MDFGMGLFVGLLLALLAFAMLAWGMHLGLEMAVDNTRKKGHFTAYGKRWLAEQLPPEQQGHVPPRPMPATRRP